jgi:cyclopropane fatty-acyl-phospholipid synthase-like methyltransferase
MTFYDDGFYAFEDKTGMDSARVIVPLILQLGSFKSVLDVGCGVGGWLKVFSEQGVLDFVGVDGPWIRNQKLMIPKMQTLTHDLQEPLMLNRTFDLVVSLEVAEHLPYKKAETFVNSLVTHGDIILFSAAIPGQVGTHHVNKQWPSFWAEIFDKHGFVVVDCLRREIWDNQQVAFWYAQNIMFFIKKTQLDKYPKLQGHYAGEKKKQLNIVHPILLEYILNTNVSLFGSVKLFLKALKNKLK